MVTGHRQPAGFSLVELLIVISVMAVLAGLVLPSSNPSIHDQLRSVAHIMATDLAYCRSLAVSNDSYYKITFDTIDNRYILEHDGTNKSLDTLPNSPFRNPDDPPEQHIVNLNDLPRIGAPVEIVTMVNTSNIWEQIDDVTFGPLGETARSGYTYICLSAGAGSAKRYIWLQINPVTGLTTVSTFTGYAPPAWLVDADSDETT